MRNLLIIYACSRDCIGGSLFFVVFFFFESLCSKQGYTILILSLQADVKCDTLVIAGGRINYTQARTETLDTELRQVFSHFQFGFCSQN